MSDIGLVSCSVCSVTCVYLSCNIEMRRRREFKKESMSTTEVSKMSRKIMFLIRSV